MNITTALYAIKYTHKGFEHIAEAIARNRFFLPIR